MTMVGRLLTAIFVAAGFLSAQAQTQVELNIRHKFGTRDFKFGETVQNNLGHDFSINRIDYYISGISIKHDGGTVTNVPASHYILATGDNDVISDLGNYAITDVESISFHVGVDAAANRADPGLQPKGHPLALRSPSMHWGWAAGYLFIAIEGNCGDALAKYFSIHALSNALYLETTVPVTGRMVNGKLVIALNADFTKFAEDIDLSTGKAAHGSGADETKMAENFRDLVFSQGVPVSIKNAQAENVNVQIYPNPAQGNANIMFGGNAVAAEINVVDVSGRVVLKMDKAASVNAVALQLQPGMYFVNMAYADGSRATQKLSVY